MEIIKRAKGKADGEIVSWNENPNCVREEVLRRSAKAGYCNRDGTSVSAGNGDRCRPFDKKKYDENYEKIFGKNKGD